MAKLVTVERCSVEEPLYDIDPRTGDSIEIFYADSALAKSFGTRPGWHWWSCRSGSLPDRLPTGPFPTSYAAYRDTPGSPKSVAHFGKRPSCQQACVDPDLHWECGHSADTAVI
jgi:hypothetical protein